MSDFHTLIVSEVKKETPNAVLVSFVIPEHLKETFSFTAGQYITFRHTLDGNEIRRAYSICSVPGDGTIKVGIKKVDGGAFSVYANETLKKGDEIEVMKPEGKFICETNKDATNNYAAFAAGSGITPVLSIIKTVLKEELNSTFLLAFGNQSQKEAMFYEELMTLEQESDGRLQIEWVFSRERVYGAKQGRLNGDIVNYLLKNKFEQTSFSGFYLCGPELMINEVSATLKDHGINESLVHFELFTSSNEGELEEAHDGNTEITILLDDEEKTFTMPQDKSILEAALAQDLDAPFSCQGGICSTCIARVKEGKAEMRKNQILTDGEIADGFILTCQAHPTTAKVVVDYDDV
ncbi:2Fe-2S iron-sulfur cluster-binding protein [Patiriisocius sp. Uisw_047]|uniref:2Fe-2S iron-sulfur cluster-binding protein n=1 Tax=Patiriisocius sp. Uisw_047 TaxID=3230969 RepID=UPI0039E77496